MKILSTGIYQNYQMKNQVISRPLFDAPKDTFVKSTPSFKGVEKVTMQAIAGWLGIGVASGLKVLIDHMNGGNAEPDTEGNLFGDYFSKMFQEKDAKINELEKIIEKLEQEKADLEAKLEEKTAVVSEKSSTEDDSAETAQIKDEPKEMQSVIFPSKRGKLSAAQTSLKEAVTAIKISPEYSKKLTEICQDILAKGSKDEENIQRTINITDALIKCSGDTEKLKSVIDTYSINTDAKNSESEKSQPDEKEKTEEIEEIYDPISQRKLPRPKQVGTVDLSKIPSDRRKSAKQNQTVKEAQIPTPEIPKENPTPVLYNVFSEELGEGKYRYICQGTVSAKTKDELTGALRFFERSVKEEEKQRAEDEGTDPDFLHWMYKTPTEHVRKEDIKNEITKCKKHGRMSEYKNINYFNAESVAEAMNEVPKLKELFTFHGATRFIDRLMDFNSEKTLQEQISDGIDILERTLQFALKQGIIMEKYQTAGRRTDEITGRRQTVNYIGTRFTIPKEYFISYAEQIFGVYPLKLGICRDAKNNAIICTVFPEGVY